MENKEKQIRFEHQASDKDHFIFAMFNDINIGYAWFKIKDHNASICYISVEKQYRQCQVGSAMLDCIEIICRENHVDNIEGKFYPYVEAKVALDFYNKNGYTHFRDGYEQFIRKAFYTHEKAPVQTIIERDK